VERCVVSEATSEGAFQPQCGHLQPPIMVAVDFLEEPVDSPFFFSSFDGGCSRGRGCGCSFGGSNLNLIAPATVDGRTGSEVGPVTGGLVSVRIGVED